MISRIYKFISEHICRLIPVKFRTWIYSDFMPSFVWTLLIILFYHQFPLMIYMCWRWKGWILYCLGYFLWTRYDYETMRTVGRKYFPLRLIKLADLPPDKNYILAAYPHALAPLGTHFNLATSANNVKDLFPDIDIRTVSMTAIFYVPGFREYLMSMGHCTFDMANLLYLMNSTPSKALLIWPGAFDEFTYSCSGGVYTIAMSQKGFIILALKSGASLVPVFSFGEQNIFDRVELTWPLLVSFNEWFHKRTKGNLCFWKGRGGYGSFLPYRRPVTTVVGKPIDVPKCRNPSVKLINKYHEEFSKALRDLFEEYKGKFDEAGDAAQLIMK